MPETINDRIEMLVNERFEGNKAAFAKAIGLPPTGLSSYLSKQRRSKPNVDLITKIVVTLNVDARWLLTGENATSPRSVVTATDHSAVALGGSATTITGTAETCAAMAVQAEKIKALETLLAEKERLIQVLMAAK